MKLKKRRKESHDESLYPEYYFKWKDFLEVWDNKVRLVTRKKSIEDLLYPYIGKNTSHVHRNFKEKVASVINDAMYGYFTTLLMDIVNTGKIVKLPGDYG
jgi:hypothetical protein